MMHKAREVSKIETRLIFNLCPINRKQLFIYLVRPNDADYKRTQTQTLTFTDVGTIDDAVYKCIVEDDRGIRHEGQYTVTIAPGNYLL